MSDFGSDLTESDEEVPLSAQSQARRGQSGEYQMKGALQAPRATSYTTQALFDQLVGNDIDLNADYQRDVVWPDYKQTGLIDSVFRNFYIPPLIFGVTYNQDGSENRVCIDGKQRLTSIYRFLRGDIPYKDPYTNDKFLFKTGGAFTQKAKILPQRYKKIFCNKQIVCMEYQSLTSDSEREIFQRVQLGMALTPAEKLQAINSEAATFIRELQTQYVADGLASTLDWDTTRGADFRCLSTAVFNMHKWPEVSTLVGLTQIQSWLQQLSTLPSSLCDNVHTVFHIFLMLSKDTKFSKVFRLPGVAKVAPVEFMAISLLIYVHKDQLTLAQLSEAIGKMRKEVRAAEVDIRMNARVMKPMLAFIKKLKVSTLKADSGQPPAAVKAGTMKRKRTVKTDPDDEEDGRERRPPAPSSEATTTSALQPPPAAPTSGRPSAPSPSVPTSSSTASETQPPHGSFSQPSTSSRPSYPSTSFSGGSTTSRGVDRLSAVRQAKAGEPPSHPPPSAPAALRNAASSGPPGASNRSNSFPSAASLPPPPTLPARFAAMDPAAVSQSTTQNGRSVAFSSQQQHFSHSNGGPSSFRNGGSSSYHNSSPSSYPTNASSSSYQNGAPSSYPTGPSFSYPPPPMGTPIQPGPASSQGGRQPPPGYERRNSSGSQLPPRPSDFGNTWLKGHGQ